MPTSHAALLDAICDISLKAGARIMEFYKQDYGIERKGDNSPVTEADLAAHHIIVPALQALTPDIAVISEESATHVNLKPGRPFWLVDPLDGTKSFIKQSGEFTVNIGLIENGVPALGAIYIPAQDVLYGGLVGEGAFRADGKSTRRPIHTRPAPKDGVDVVMSLSHVTPETKAFVEKLNVREAVQAASSLKFCAVAEGRADIYPRFGRTMEWDTAAGQAILEAAGGRVTTPEGTPFTYNKPDFANGFFVAYGQ